MKNTIQYFILCIALLSSSMLLGQDNSTTPQPDSNQLESCKLRDIIYDTTHLDISEKVNISKLNEAFGERNTYNIIFYVLIELNYKDEKCTIEIKYILLKGTSFVDKTIKEQFINELEDYFKSLYNKIDKSKLKDGCKEYGYRSAIRLC